MTNVYLHGRFTAGYAVDAPVTYLRLFPDCYVSQLTVGAGIKVSNYGTIGNQGAFGLKGSDSVTVHNGGHQYTSPEILGVDLALGYNCALVNYGTISLNAGVSLQSGDVVNGNSADTGASIRGGYGLKFLGAAGTVANFGTIVGSDSSRYSIGLLHGGRITNGSAVATRALISGGEGIKSVGDAATVTNFGYVMGTRASGGGLRCGPPGRRRRDQWLGQ